MRPISILKKCYSMFGSYSQNVWIIISLRIVLSFLSIISAYFISMIIAQITNGNIFKDIYKYITGLTATYLLSSVIKYYQFNLQQKVEKNVRVIIKKELMHQMLNSYPEFLTFADSSKANEIMYSDCNNITTLVFTAISFFSGILTSVVMLYFLVSINAALALLITVIVIIESIYIFKQSDKLHELNIELRQVTDAHFKLSRDLSQYMKSICVSDSVNYHYTRYYKNLESVKEKTIFINFETWKPGYITGILENVWMIFCLLLGIMMLGNSKIDTASFILFLSYSRIYSSSITGLFDSYSKSQQIFVSVDRVFGLIESCQRNEPRKATISSEIFSIKILNLKFSYEDKIIFDGYSREMSGGIVLVTGRNGAGKTTLLNLIAGLIKIQQGDIFYNGVSINELSRESLRKNVAYLAQDDIVFNVSVRENILSFSSAESIEMSDLIAVCDAIGIYDEIKALPDGFDTLVQEIRDFSFGQKKKMLLARTFLRPSKIVLLDEPLAGLDKNSQEKLINYLSTQAEKRMIIIATHNPKSFSRFSNTNIIDVGLT